MPRRRIEVVVEQDEIILVRRRRGAVRMWCSQCEAQVSMLRVEDASAAAATTARSICRWIEGGKLHFVESGLLLICAQSLAALVSAERPVERKRTCYIGKDDSVPDGGHL
jgi:hypothetical protein